MRYISLYFCKKDMRISILCKNRAISLHETSFRTFLPTILIELSSKLANYKS